MYSLLVRLDRSELLIRQLPSLLGAFLIAEFFYKFGSFALECVAFLGTWFILDAAIGFIFPGRKAATRPKSG